MGINDYGTPADPLNSPPLSDWAASVATVVDGDDTTVNARIAAAVAGIDAGQYLLPTEVLAGANVTVDTATTPGSVIIASTGSGGTSDQYGAHYVMLVAGSYGYRGSVITDRPVTPAYADGAFMYVDTSTDPTKVTPPSELNPVVGDVWKPQGSVTPVSG